jgi:hypothetical protein
MAQRHMKRRAARQRRGQSRSRQRRASAPAIRDGNASALTGALTTLTGALSVVASASDRATLALEGARVEAVMQAEERLVRSLAADRLLHDLLGLRVASRGDIAEESVATFQNFAVAVQAWLAEHLHLEPFLEIGSEREVPASQLPNYDLLGDAPQSGDSLLPLKVLTPGWKWRGRVVVKPEVGVATDASAVPGLRPR